ncbi:MAG: NAD-dependent epimerase/dehydratase family protein [Labilithrix sp.]|nr:NAD-dependent epimerase/dehydratase family protein [Labilithrix sp.]MCW5817942.1 NAD-dependent epimerase/dehydratase family protein [Labilithrix sp.]
MKVIITGATGYVGSGVLAECLRHPDVTSVLCVDRRPNERHEAKLKQLVVRDFMDLAAVKGELVGYDACFYCAGVSSVGMSEEAYTKITHDMALHFAETVLALNPQMVLCHVSGMSTDGSEEGRVMWARVKGRAENALARLPFEAVYNFRPGIMKPDPDQGKVKALYRVLGALYPVLDVVAPRSVSTVADVGRAMIHCVQRGYPKTVLEVPDIREAARA